MAADRARHVYEEEQKMLQNKGQELYRQKQYGQALKCFNEVFC